MFVSAPVLIFDTRIDESERWTHHLVQTACSDLAMLIRTLPHAVPPR